MILDEADRILDEYFAEQMASIIDGCSKQRQTLMFSATMTTEVKTVATAALSEPIKVSNSILHYLSVITQFFYLNV